MSDTNSGGKVDVAGHRSRKEAGRAGSEQKRAPHAAAVISAGALVCSGLPGSQILASTFEGEKSGRWAQALRDMALGLTRCFQTPVSSIEGAVWLLEDTQIPEEMRAEFLGIIRKETNHLRCALSDILLFAHPPAPRYAKVNASGLVDRAIQLAAPREPGCSVIFRKEIFPDLPPLNGDAELLTKMLQNVATNAIEATPNGGQIRISAEMDAGNILISVTDHGHGIAPGTAQKVFDPFFTTRENALGLGLTVAQHIAAAHGGRITIGELTGRGTCVTVVLPLQPPAADTYGPHISS